MNHIILYDDSSRLKNFTSIPTNNNINTASPIKYAMYKHVEWFTWNEPLSCITMFLSSIDNNAYFNISSTFIS